MKAGMSTIPVGIEEEKKTGKKKWEKERTYIEHVNKQIENICPLSRWSLFLCRADTSIAFGERLKEQEKKGQGLFILVSDCRPSYMIHFLGNFCWKLKIWSEAFQSINQFTHTHTQTIPMRNTLISWPHVFQWLWRTDKTYRLNKIPSLISSIWNSLSRSFWFDWNMLLKQSN